MVTIILTAAKEPNTIGKALDSILNLSFSGLNQEFELLTVIPDSETLEAARKTIANFPDANWCNLKDPGKGKPVALNLAFKEAKGEILLLTDGDVYFGERAIKEMLKPFSDPKVGGVTGRPKALETKKTMMGYYANLLADAAHHKRMVTMRPDAVGNSLKFISKDPGFFVLSGYIMAIRNLKLEIPEDCLADDAYISYEIHNRGYKTVYQPEAKVFVKYATNLGDWYKQKLRSVGGYMQLWKYGVIKPETKVRNFWKELEYIWFPIRYAKSIKEYLWSFALYFFRLWLWLRIFYEQKILKKDFYQTWVRVESTK